MIYPEIEDITVRTNTKERKNYWFTHHLRWEASFFLPNAPIDTDPLF